MLHRFNFHKSKQSIHLAYTRITLIYICINIIRFKHWIEYIKDVSMSLYQNINSIINKVYQLTYIKNMNQNKLVPEILYDKEKYNKQIINNIKRDKLKFKYHYESFGIYDNLELLQYILQKQDDWVMNSSDLNDLYKHFNGRFNKEYLRKKCFKYGVEYMFEK